MASAYVSFDVWIFEFLAVELVEKKWVFAVCFLWRRNVCFLGEEKSVLKCGPAKKNCNDNFLL